MTKWVRLDEIEYLGLIDRSMALAYLIGRARGTKEMEDCMKAYPLAFKEME